MKLRNTKIIIISCALFILNNANALDITIEQGVENPIPVAIVPFGWSQATNLPEDLSEIISGDLERSDLRQWILKIYHNTQVNFKM